MGARRVDWTIHIGIIIRNIANLMGLYARFEHGRTDAVLRSAKYKDLVAIEWEWEGVWWNELDKLKKRAAKDPLHYCVLITYTHTPKIEEVYTHVLGIWQGATCPLLLGLVDFEDSKDIRSHRVFLNISFSVFDGETQRQLRISPALPWELDDTSWSSQKI